MEKTKDLQPLFDYFDMLRQCERDGYLEIKTDEHEAYITQPCLFMISGVGFSTRELGYDIDKPYILNAVRHTSWRILSLAAFRAAPDPKEKGYLVRPFALHVVKPDEPHDLLYTLIVSPRNRRLMPWSRARAMKVVSYDDAKK